MSREDERERDIVALRTTAERSAAAASTTAEGKMNPSKNQPDEIAQLARDLVDRSPEPLASLECQADFAESVSQADRVWLDRRLAASRRVLDRDHPSRAPRWVPTLYAAMGLPYALVAGVAATMLRDMNMPDDQITLHLGGIGVVWSLKPLWAPLLGIAWTKREWILLMQGCLAGLFACLALLLGTNAHGLLFAVLWLVALASATQDICADGVYLSALDKRRQAVWAGVQSMSWTAGRVLATGAVVWVAGRARLAGYGAWAPWRWAFGVGAGFMFLFAMYHYLVLPTGSRNERWAGARDAARKFVDVGASFLKKHSLLGMVAFVLCYRMSEGFLVIEAKLFLKAPIADGGLGLSLADMALVDGTMSTLAGVAGGLVGAWLVQRMGLKRALFPLAVFLNFPHVVYIILSYLAATGHGTGLSLVMVLVSVEQFGYYVGAIGCMVYLMQQMSPGKYKMAHYAIATALMNVALVPTQMVSGPLKERLGYPHFFVFVFAASIPSLIAAWKAPFPDPHDPFENDARRPARRRGAVPKVA